MNVRHPGIALAALLGAAAVAAPAFAQNEQFIPNLVYRTGAYSPNGVPFAGKVFRDDDPTLIEAVALNAGGGVQQMLV